MVNGVNVKDLPGAGGGGFFFEGLITGHPRESIKKSGPNAGEVSWYVPLSWFGGNASLKLANPEQRQLCQRGTWARFEAEIKEFDGNQYAGPATLTHVNKKAVDASGLKVAS